MNAMILQVTVTLTPWPLKWDWWVELKMHVGGSFVTDKQTDKKQYAPFRAKKNSW